MERRKERDREREKRERECVNTRVYRIQCTRRRGPVIDRKRGSRRFASLPTHFLRTHCCFSQPIVIQLTTLNFRDVCADQSRCERRFRRGEPPFARPGAIGRSALSLRFLIFDTCVCACVFTHVRENTYG